MLFPHFCTSFVIFIFVMIVFILACCFEYKKLTFMASISANIFTGLVICVLSGKKDVSYCKYKHKKQWLENIHSLILEFFDLYMLFLLDTAECILELLLRLKEAYRFYMELKRRIGSKLTDKKEETRKRRSSSCSRSTYRWGQAVRNSK